MFAYNVEIKAQCANLERVRMILKTVDASFSLSCRQKDYYISGNDNVLKVRESGGNITIFKKDGNQLREVDNALMGELLISTCKVERVVEKTREIYVVGNVRINLDTVENLGTFVEIVAGTQDAESWPDGLIQQCKYYLSLLGLKAKDVTPFSYADIQEKMVG